jgi:hypothetical protein
MWYQTLLVVMVIRCLVAVVGEEDTASSSALDAFVGEEETASSSTLDLILRAQCEARCFSVSHLAH